MSDDHAGSSASRVQRLPKALPEALPEALRTSRLLLRKWREEDAPTLGPILTANTDHLAPWIPPHVAAPADAEQLRARLAGFVLAFDSGQCCRYALLRQNDGRLLGGVDLFGRATEGRVPLVDASCVELGYWLRADATGHGYATEAASTLINWIRAHATLAHLEIRCDARNAPSQQVAQRLGFSLAMTTSAPSIDPSCAPIALNVWRASAGVPAPVA